LQLHPKMHPILILAIRPLKRSPKLGQLMLEFSGF
jgi:hypothetical protein